MVSADSFLKKRIKSIRANRDLGLMTVVMMRPTVAGSVWEMAHEDKLGLEYPTILEGKLRFFIRLEEEAKWKSSLDRLVSDGFLKEFFLDDSQVPIILKRDEAPEFQNEAAIVLHKVSEVLAQSGILVTMGLATAQELMVAVPRTHLEDGLKGLNEALASPP